MKQFLLALTTLLLSLSLFAQNDKADNIVGTYLCGEGIVVIFSGLQYDAKKTHWSGTKIYAPDRGISVKMTAKFEKPGTLVVRGTVLGIGEKVTWVKQ